MNSITLIIKVMVQEHAEAHPAGKDKSARCQELYSGILADFGRKSLDDFTMGDVPAVRRWLAHEADPESVKAVLSAREKILEARKGALAYIQAMEDLRRIASPIIGKALKRLNPAGIPVDDAMGGLLSGPLLDSVQEIRRGMDTAEWAAAGLLSLTRCLADGEQRKS